MIEMLLLDDTSLNNSINGPFTNRESYYLIRDDEVFALKRLEFMTASQFGRAPPLQRDKSNIHIFIFTRNEGCKMSNQMRIHNHLLQPSPLHSH